MPKIIGFDGKEKEFEENELIRDKCEEMGVPFGCKKGRCGRCKITVEEGNENLSPKNESEKEITDNENERLACQTSILKGIVKIKNY